MEFKQEEILIWLNNLDIDAFAISLLEKKYADLNELFSSSSDEYIHRVLTPAMSKKIQKNRDPNSVKSLLESLKSDEYGIMTSVDFDYPKDLKIIPDYPRVLYFKGNPEILKGNLLSIVGARKISSYGKWACEHLVKGFSEYDITIVSGLALGADSIAHKSAIENGLKTIGVLGTGIDIVYPASNRMLFEEMAKSHLILSEFKPKTRGFQQNFPIRNRIVSGLSKATIIIEAKRRSGSLITARLASEQGREVFALPGNINSVNSQGTNELIKDGAYPITTHEDVFYVVSAFKELKKKSSGSYDECFLSDDEEKVYGVLQNAPIHADLISLKTGISINELNSILTILEIKGVIKEIGGNIFTLT